MYPGYNFINGQLPFGPGQQQMQPMGAQQPGQMSPMGGQMSPMGQQPSGQLPTMGQPQQPSPLQSPTLLGQNMMQPGNVQGQQPGQAGQHNPLGSFAPMFGLAGMMGPKTWPYMIGGLGGGMLLSHLFKGHNG